MVMVFALKSFCILKMYLKKDIVFYFKIVFNIFLNNFFLKKTIITKKPPTSGGEEEQNMVP